MSVVHRKSTPVISPVQPIRMHKRRPILESRTENDWENRVVLNPAAVLVKTGEELDTLFEVWGLNEVQRAQLRKAGGACVLIYRAQGEAVAHTNTVPSFLGLAILTPDLVLVHRFQHPVLKPELPWNNLGVEDPRCTRVGDSFYLYYTGYASGYSPESSLRSKGDRQVTVCLATTKDFISWNQHGPVSGDINSVGNKNAALFPDPVNGSWLLLHRPMTGPDPMTIHAASAEDPGGPWKSTGTFLKNQDYPGMKRSWIGAGGPPVAVGDGRFVMIYHLGHFLLDGSRFYTLAAALIDFSARNPIRGRIEPIMIPSGPGEQIGDPHLGVNNVLFTCGNYLWKNDLIIPYAAADSRIFGAKINFIQLIEALDTTTRN